MKWKINILKGRACNLCTVDMADMYLRLWFSSLEPSLPESIELLESPVWSQENMKTSREEVDLCIKWKGLTKVASWGLHGYSKAKVSWEQSANTATRKMGSLKLEMQSERKHRRYQYSSSIKWSFRAFYWIWFEIVIWDFTLSQHSYWGRLLV